MDATRDCIDQIYAAAVDRTGWPEVIGRLQTMFGCLSAGMYSSDADGKEVGIVDCRGVEPEFVRTYIDRFLCDNPWLSLPQLQQPGAIRTDASLDQCLCKPGYYRTTALFNEWMKPQGFIHSLGSNVLAEGPLKTKLFLYRSARAGPFSSTDIRRFERLNRHLMRAAEITRRLAQKESATRDLLDTADSLPFGIAWLDGSLRLLEVNRIAKCLLDEADALQPYESRPRAAHRADDRQLTAALQAARAVHLGVCTEGPSAVRLRRPPGRRALRVHAIPLPRRTENPFLLRHAAVLLMISDPERESVVPAQRLRASYGLTASEARLAMSLLDGAGLREAAQRSSFTYETARSYLKSIFQKTGTRRQSELVAMLLRDHLELQMDALPARDACRHP